MENNELMKLEINNLEEKLLFILLNHQNKAQFIFNNCIKEVFTDFINAKIFEIAKKLWEKYGTIDSSLICQYLNTNELNKVLVKLYDIQTYCFAVSPQCGTYCKILFEKYLDRCYKSIKTEEDFIRLSELKEKFVFNDSETNTHISANIQELISGYEQQSTGAIYTLYGKLDECLGSLNGGDYVVLGASTSVGKSTFALNVAKNVCIQDKTVLYFSLEMPKMQLQNKLICMQEKIAANKYRSSGLNPIEFERYKQAAKDLEQWKLYTICDYGLTPEKMRILIQKQKEKGLDFVVLDYLGLMSGYGNKNLYEKTTLLSREMKLMATEFDVPILCLVQLNRDLKNRPDKRPCLFDIRESGAIEQDADIVLLLHREGLYDDAIPKNILEVIVSKNRHGESNKIIKLNFDLKTQNISDMY